MPRIATLELARSSDERTLRATLPTKVDAKEFAAFSKSLLDVIHEHTGCTCLSGIIRVVIQEEALIETVKVNF